MGIANWSIHVLPIFFDGISEVSSSEYGAIEVIERRIAFNVRGEILAGVGAHARLRVPPVVAGAPRKDCNAHTTS